jgi:hypothetical protein
MEKPAIELKNIKHAAFASEETHCYSATLYVDGEKWGTVGNQGHGGPDSFEPVPGRKYDDILALDRRIKATMPPQEYQGLTLDQSLEGICGDLVNEFLMDKDFARAMKSKLLFTQPGKPGVFEIKPRKGATVAQCAEHARKTQPTWRLLVDMPPAEARAVYFA